MGKAIFHPVACHFESFKRLSITMGSLRFNVVRVPDNGIRHACTQYCQFQRAKQNGFVDEAVVGSSERSTVHSYSS